jgi:hypothetical protein
MYRPIWRISQIGVKGVSSPRHARRKVASDLEVIGPVAVSEALPLSTRAQKMARVKNWLDFFGQVGYAT